MLSVIDTLRIKLARILDGRSFSARTSANLSFVAVSGSKHPVGMTAGGSILQSDTGQTRHYDCQLGVRGAGAENANLAGRSGRSKEPVDSGLGGLGNPLGAGQELRRWMVRGQRRHGAHSGPMGTGRSPAAPRALAV